MFIVFKRPRSLMDCSKYDDERPILIQPGRYEVERVESLLGKKYDWWLVLRGTKIGNREQELRSWGPNLGEFEIIVED